MSGILVCTTSSNVPEWAIKRARDLGVRLLPLSNPSNVQPPTHSNLARPTLLSRDRVHAQLAELQPDGYLMNGPPEYGPYFDGELSECSQNLRLVTYFGQSLEPAEYDSFLDPEALHRRGISMTTTPGATESVAEGTIALILALNLRLLPHNAAMKSGYTLQLPTRSGLLGQKIGIVGMGQIGQRVAGIVHALGMRILYHSRTSKPEIDARFDAQRKNLGELFSDSNVVSIHTPGSVTAGVIDEAVLSHARGIDLVNTTSVPRIVDHEALLSALEDGRIARAAIEGSYDDPVDRQLRAFDDSRVILLPAYTSWDTEHSWRNGWSRYLETLEAFVSGQPLPYKLKSR